MLQGPDTRPFWLLGGTYTAQGEKFSFRWAEHADNKHILKLLIVLIVFVFFPFEVADVLLIQHGTSIMYKFYLFHVCWKTWGG